MNSYDKKFFGIYEAPKKGKISRQALLEGVSWLLWAPFSPLLFYSTQFLTLDGLMYKICLNTSKPLK